MNPGSLRLRLFAAGAAAVLAALTIAALGLSLLFERHVERRAVAELSARLDQLAAGLERRSGGEVLLAHSPADPGYAQPLSGLYWQIETGTEVLRSRSLWDYVLPLATDGAQAGGSEERRLVGPQGEDLLVLERRLTLASKEGDVSLRAAVAMDRAELSAAGRAFLGDLAPYIALLAAALIAAGWAQVTIGLRPLAAVGARVAALRSGAAARLGGDFPAEVQPLAAEIDALLAAREAETARARARAGDLAHGLKTPLQALIGEAARLRAGGEAAAALGIEEIVLSMRRHVDRELARARIAAAGHAASTDPGAAICGVLSVLRRTPDGSRVDWRIHVPPDLRVRMDIADLIEALGALAENAARHAGAQVAITASRRADKVAIVVSDDGPGIAEAQLTAMRRRGARLDVSLPGDGLGLAIATEIAEATGGALALAAAAPGLEATLLLLAAPGPKADIAG